MGNGGGMFGGSEVSQDLHLDAAQHVEVLLGKRVARPFEERMAGPEHSKPHALERLHQEGYKDGNTLSCLRSFSTWASYQL